MFLRKHIIRVICIIGCIGQLYVATDNFFKFEVRYGVQIDFPESYEIPNIDFIIPLVAYLNQTKLLIRFNKLLQEFADDSQISVQRLLKSHYALSELLASEIKVKDIEELMLNPEKDIISLGLKEMDNVDILEKYCKIDRFFSSKNIHLRVSCHNNSKPIVLNSETISTDSRVLLTIIHQINSLFAIRLSDINSNMDPRVRSYTFIPSARERLEFIQLTFRRIHYNALPYPHTTDCKDYDGNHILHNCIRDAMLNLPNRTLYSAAILPFYKYPGHLGFQQITEKDRDSIYKHCSKAVSQIDCHSIAYELRKDTIEENFSSNFKFLSIVPSNYPDLHYLAYPVQESTQFIIFFMSILSNWFGLSIFDQLIYGTSHCQMCKKRKTKNSKTTKKNEWQQIEVTTTYSIPITQKLFKPRY